MRLLFIFIIVFLGQTLNAKHDSKVDSLLKCLKSNDFIENYYSDYLHSFIDSGQSIFRGWNLNYEDSLQRRIFENLLEEHFNEYIEEVKRNTVYHYQDLDSTTLSKYLALCDQIQLHELREQTGYFQVMDSLMLLVGERLTHDSPYILGRIKSKYKPLKLQLMINEDIYKNLLYTNIKLELITSDTMYPRVNILSPATLVIEKPLELRCKDIQYLLITYNGQEYKFSKREFTEEDVPDQSKRELLNNMLIGLTISDFEYTEMWRIEITDSHISLQTSVKKETQELKNSD
ncbi:hypothetical protein GYB22_12105 [bacterium]|nr:hypothetical protein [bacterium]